VASERASRPYIRLADSAISRAASLPALLVVEFIPRPEADSHWTLVPVVGETTPLHIMSHDLVDNLGESLRVVGFGEGRDRLHPY
jgi:hypothetical protein